MGDYSYFTLQILKTSTYKNRQAKVEELLSELQGNDLELDPLMPLIGRYTAEEMRLDAYEELGRELMAADKGMTFYCWNDPKYEWLGGIFMYTPKLGAFQADCNSDGRVLFSNREVETLLKSNLDETQMRTALGLAWEDEFARIRKEAQRVRDPSQA